MFRGAVTLITDEVDRAGARWWFCRLFVWCLPINLSTLRRLPASGYFKGSRKSIKQSMLGSAQKNVRDKKRVGNFPLREACSKIAPKRSVIGHRLCQYLRETFPYPWKCFYTAYWSYLKWPLLYRSNIKRWKLSASKAKFKSIDRIPCAVVKV